jgi:hypothetical protein
MPMYTFVHLCMCSDGRDYPFLAKPKDDLRKDYRLMDFAGGEGLHYVGCRGVLCLV